MRNLVVAFAALLLCAFGALQAFDGGARTGSDLATDRAEGSADRLLR
jgi:hypothetical protein